MSGPILIKLNVSKVDKTHLFQGKNGKYLDVVLMPNRDGTDQYGNDFMAVQGVSKEARDAGVKGAILGNARWLGTKIASKPAVKPQPTPEDSSEDDKLPF